ncbi:MAG: hypothetical protein MI810_01355 [Flavobacteriales bacterium]|nr:hypothetical protein [Flavobacteriales bacterium]
MSNFHYVFGIYDIEDFLTTDAKQRIEQNKCPFLKDENISHQHYILAGRYNVDSKSHSLTITLGVKETKHLSIEAGYVGVSQKFYERKSRTLKIINWLNGLSVLTIIFSIICALVYWIWDYSIPELIHVPGYVWIFLSLQGGFWLVIGDWWEKRIEKNVAKKLLKRTQSHKIMGVPQYTNREMKLLVETNDIAAETEKVRQRELAAAN